MVMLASHAECRIEQYSEREDNKDKRYGLHDILCLLLLLAGCAGEPKVKRTIEGMKTYAEMTDGTWTCDGRSYAYRLEIRGRLSRAACDSVFVYLSNVPEISFERAAKAAGLSSNSDDYFAPEEAVLVELGTE